MTLAFVGALALLALLAMGAYGVVRTLNEHAAFDAAQINYAGRQRLLAQRIARAAVSTVAAVDPATRDAVIWELSESRSRWKRGDSDLRVGNTALGLAPLTSGRELQQIQGLQPAVVAIDTGVDELLRQPSSTSREASWRLATSVARACDAYIAGMDALVMQVQRESEQRARRMDVVVTWMMVVAMMVLATEGLFVFRPLVRKLAGAHDTLVTAYGKLQKEMALRARAERDRERLEGLLPICASCKNIRDIDGTWRRLEQFIEARSEAHFTHGLCEKCLRKLYPEQAARILDGDRE